MSAKIAEKPKYMGHEVHFYESHFNREIGKYERFAASLRPIVEELGRIGLPPLTPPTFRSLIAGKFDPIIDQFRKLANEDASKVGFVFRPVAAGAIENGVAALNSFLSQQTNMLRASDEQSDIPMVEGVPTVTDEFRTELREKYTMRVRTEEGALFYEKFLEAKSAVQELMKMGYMPEAAYVFDMTEGLHIRHMDL